MGRETKFTVQAACLRHTVFCLSVFEQRQLGPSDIESAASILFFWHICGDELFNRHLSCFVFCLEGTSQSFEETALLIRYH